MEITKRRGILAEAEDLKRIAPHMKGYDYIDVTEWQNGEGFTISLNIGENPRIFDIHENELDAINYLVQKLRYED